MSRKERKISIHPHQNLYNMANLYYNPSSSRYLCVFFRQSRRKYLVDKQLSRLAGIPEFCVLIVAF